MNVLRRHCIGTLAAIGLALVTSPVVAQHGVGGDEGVARSRVRTEVVTLAGEIVAINVGPCERTTGRARVGAHLLVERAATADESTGDVAVEPWNVHVGPAAAVHEMVAKFPIGTQVTIQAFRTENMPANHYAAQTIASADATVTLRDESLRPAWAGQGGSGVVDRPMGGDGPRYGRGSGHGHGRGYGQGRGSGYGRGDRHASRPHWRMAW